ncbi:MAG: dTMP kinase [Gammaproteobacteria bacterium]|nr:dTMP kinase [Gammaproteobacteria bacterium]
MRRAQAGTRGRFVTLEGIEGVGKSTHLEFVAGTLRAAGLAVVVTREPGGVPLAERIREILLAPGEIALPPMSELLLMFAARAAHVAELIAPSLAAGTWVVCDRFTDASYAYQGAGRGLPEPVIAQLEAAVQNGLHPDLTLLLDADWEATRLRRAKRGASDRFEREDAAFFGRVRAGYLARALAEPQRIRVIDASGGIDTVQAGIRNELAAFMQGQGGA